MELLWIVPRKGEPTRTYIDSDNYLKVFAHSWFINNSGYVASRVNGTYTLLHRLILGLNPNDGVCVDHINQNRLDNRLANLRFCTRSQNVKNKSVYRNNRCGFKGVNARELSDGSLSYRARIRVDGKLIQLGTYSNPIDAAKAYDAKALEFFGEFASLNFKESVGVA